MINQRAINVYEGDRLIGRIIEHDTSSHLLSTHPPTHWQAERPDGTNLGRIFWTYADAARALGTKEAL